MPKTFKDLQDDILLRANMNEYDRPFVKMEINAAVQDLYREKRWSWMEAEYSLVLPAGDNQIPVGSYESSFSSTWGRIQSVADPQDQAVPIPMFVPYTTDDPAYPWVHQEYPVPFTFPRHYTRFGGLMIFDAAPVQDVEYRVISWDFPPEVVSDGDLIPVPDMAVDAVMWRALSRAVLVHDRDVQTSQLYRAEYAEQVTRLKGIDNGAATPLRVAMPPGYGGAYDG